MPETRKAIEYRWRAFVGEYIKDFNAQRAYEDCGCYSIKGKKANVAGYQLLKRTKIQELIADAIKARNARLELEQDKVVLEQLRLAMSDIRNYVDWGPDGVRLKDSSKLTEDQAAAIAEVSETVTKDGGTVKFKLHNKATALESLFRHLGLYEADNRRILDFGVAEVPADTDDESWDKLAHQAASHAEQNGHSKTHMDS